MIRLILQNKSFKFQKIIKTIHDQKLFNINRCLNSQIPNKNLKGNINMEKINFGNNVTGYEIGNKTSPGLIIIQVNNIPLHNNISNPNTQ